MSKFTDTVTKFNPRLTKDLSITDVQAAGIWGNVGGETGGLTALQEKNPTVAGSKGGWGWMQWTGPRRRAFLAWCEKEGLDPSADEANYRYLVFETITLEPKSLVGLRKTTTTDAATETFMLLNLRPGIQHLDVRQRWAEKAYAAIQTKITPKPVTPEAPKPRPAEQEQVETPSVSQKNPVWNFLKGLIK